MSNVPHFLHTIPLQVNNLHSKLIADHKNLLLYSQSLKGQTQCFTYVLPPVFLPGEPQGQRSLEGYSPWGRKESDMTEGDLPAMYLIKSKMYS